MLVNKAQVTVNEMYCCAIDICGDIFSLLNTDLRSKSRISPCLSTYKHYMDLSIKYLSRGFSTCQVFRSSILHVLVMF